MVPIQTAASTATARREDAVTTGSRVIRWVTSAVRRSCPGAEASTPLKTAATAKRRSASSTAPGSHAASVVARVAIAVRPAQAATIPTSPNAASQRARPASSEISAAIAPPACPVPPEAWCVVRRHSVSCSVQRALLQRMRAPIHVARAPSAARPLRWGPSPASKTLAPRILAGQGRTLGSTTPDDRSTPGCRWTLARSARPTVVSVASAETAARASAARGDARRLRCVSPGAASAPRAGIAARA